MRVIGFMPLHYGREYLDACLRAVEPFVNSFLISYSPKPSYGHGSNLKCPESREELYHIAKEALKDKLIWEDIKANHREGDHRNRVLRFLNNHDLILSVDSDEVWDPDYVEPALRDAYENPCSLVGLGGDCWYHFWRSFNECHRDGFYPMRFQKRSGVPFNPQEGIIHSGRIYHMGYAQSEEIVKYKLSCHGHKDEIPATYFEDKFVNYRKGLTTHMHPASNGLWIETEEFDKTTLPDILKNHVNYGKRKIT